MTGLRPYLPEDHAAIAAWCAAHGRAAPPPSSLPEHGYIVAGVAAGFLYLTDSDVALLDGYVTNPAAGLRERSEAIDAITGVLLAAAKDAGARHVGGLCASAGVERRARRLGLERIGEFVMVAREV
jgi:hypothetical protein